MLAFVPALPCNKWPSPRARAKCGGTMARSFCRGGGDGFTGVDCCWSHVKSCVLLLHENSQKHNTAFLYYPPEFPTPSLPSIFGHTIRPAPSSWPPQKLTENHRQHPLMLTRLNYLRRNSVITLLFCRIAKSPDKSTGKHQRHKNCG